MYSEYSNKLDGQGENLDSQNPCFVSEAKMMADILCKQHEDQSTRDTLLEKHRCMKAALDNLWKEVQSGKTRVGSVALLRIYRTLTCPGIAERLSNAELNREGILRELNLLINTFQYVIKPEQV